MSKKGRFSLLQWGVKNPGYFGDQGFSFHDGVQPIDVCQVECSQ